MSNKNVTNVVNPSKNGTQKTVNETKTKIETEPRNENNPGNTEPGTEYRNGNNSSNIEPGNGNNSRNTEPGNEPENVNESTETGNTSTGNTGTETGNTSTGNTGTETGNTSTGTETGNTSTGNTGTETGNTSTGTETGNTSTGTETGNTSTGTETGNTSTGTETGNTSTGTETGNTSTGTETGNTSTGTETGNSSTGNTGTGTRSGKQPTTGLGKTQGTSQSDIKELKEFINKVIKPNSKLISKIHNDKVIAIIDTITTDIEGLITGTKQIDLISAITNNLGTAISAGAKTLINKYAVPKQIFSKFMKILNAGMQERDKFISRVKINSAQPLVDIGVLLYNYSVSKRIIGGTITKKNINIKNKTQKRKKKLIRRLRNTKKK
jgi:hypothetical protein